MDCIILAGGFGTRLQDVVKEVPKPLAPINGKPFLVLLLQQLATFKHIKNVILALGYKAEAVIEYFEKHPPPIPLIYSLEKEPLGTGGCLLHAMEASVADEFLVMNGDSYLDFSFEGMQTHHRTKQADFTMAVLEVADGSRYGKVEFNEHFRIEGFKEKTGAVAPCWISAGIYLVKRNCLSSLACGKSFSLEKEGFSSLLKKRMIAYPCQGTFIDIGTKESYSEAQKVLRNL
jgi:D-glycero-alpha-D-manno-heptose 1-phosphate guanylyltransferase